MKANEMQVGFAQSSLSAGSAAEIGVGLGSSLICRVWFHPCHGSSAGVCVCAEGSWGLEWRPWTARMLSWIRLLDLPANARFYGAAKLLGPAGAHSSQRLNCRIGRVDLKLTGLGRKISAAAESVTSLSGCRLQPLLLSCSYNYFSARSISY